MSAVVFIVWPATIAFVVWILTRERKCPKPIDRPWGQNDDQVRPDTPVTEQQWTREAQRERIQHALNADKVGDEVEAWLRGQG